MNQTPWLVLWLDRKQGTWREWHAYDNQHSAECAAGMLADRLGEENVRLENWESLQKRKAKPPRPDQPELF